MAGAAVVIWLGHYDRVIELANRGIERSTDPASVAICWFQLMVALLLNGRIDEAVAAAQQAEAGLEHTDDPYANYWVRFGQGALAVVTDPAALPEAEARILEVANRYGAPWMMIGAEQARAELSLNSNDHGGALVAARKAYSLALETRSALDENIAGWQVIAALLAPTDSVPTPECRQILARVLDRRSWFSVWTILEVIANNFARVGYTEAAATIVGHLVTQPNNGSALTTGSRHQTLDIVRRNDGADEWMATGAAMTRDEIGVYTLDQLPK